MQSLSSVARSSKQSDTSNHRSVSSQMDLAAVSAPFAECNVLWWGQLNYHSLLVARNFRPIEVQEEFNRFGSGKGQTQAIGRSCSLLGTILRLREPKSMNMNKSSEEKCNISPPGRDLIFAAVWMALEKASTTCFLCVAKNLMGFQRTVFE